MSVDPPPVPLASAFLHFPLSLPEPVVRLREEESGAEQGSPRGCQLPQE